MYTFLESCFFSFIWYQIRLNVVKLEVGHDLNNMKSMEKFNSNPFAMVIEFNSVYKYYQQKTYMELF